MKIFVDNCVPFRFCRLIDERFEVTHCREMGWQEYQNGRLVKVVAEEFDVMVSIDKNMSFQTNISDLELTVFVLDAVTNRLTTLAAFVEPLMDALQSPRPGQYILVRLT